MRLIIIALTLLSLIQAITLEEDRKGKKEVVHHTTVVHHVYHKPHHHVTHVVHHTVEHHDGIKHVYVHHTYEEPHHTIIVHDDDGHHYHHGHEHVVVIHKHSHGWIIGCAVIIFILAIVLVIGITNRKGEESE